MWCAFFVALCGALAAIGAASSNDAHLFESMGLLQIQLPDDSAVDTRPLAPHFVQSGEGPNRTVSLELLPTVVTDHMDESQSQACWGLCFVASFDVDASAAFLHAPAVERLSRHPQAESHTAHHILRQLVEARARTQKRKGNLGSEATNVDKGSHWVLDDLEFTTLSQNRPQKLFAGPTPPLVDIEEMKNVGNWKFCLNSLGGMLYDSKTSSCYVARVLKEACVPISLQTEGGSASWKPLSGHDRAAPGCSVHGNLGEYVSAPREFGRHTRSIAEGVIKTKLQLRVCLSSSDSEFEHRPHFILHNGHHINLRNIAVADGLDPEAWYPDTTLFRRRVCNRFEVHQSPCYSDVRKCLDANAGDNEDASNPLLIMLSVGIIFLVMIMAMFSIGGLV